ncbi:MAG: hypothetical protein GF363_07095 [Chitinivibrionales bacterium]|nr:hypothetical protein [Chitinivibrionales bacterium]
MKAKSQRGSSEWAGHTVRCGEEVNSGWTILKVAVVERGLRDTSTWLSASLEGGA